MRTREQSPVMSSSIVPMCQGLRGMIMLQAVALFVVCFSGRSFGQFVVQPWDRPGNSSRFMVPAEALSTHRFVWSESSISFASWVGHGAYPPSADDLMAG